LHSKSQLGWLNLSHLPILPSPVTAKQRMVIIPGDQPEEGIDDYGEKEIEKRNVLRREWKTPQERLISTLTRNVPQTSWQLGSAWTRWETYSTPQTLELDSWDTAAGKKGQGWDRMKGSEG